MGFGVWVRVICSLRALGVPGLLGLHGFCFFWWFRVSILWFRVFGFLGCRVGFQGFRGVRV